MEQKIYAGAAIRRVRRKAGLTQIAMAGQLDISPSYLNLVERNQRPVSALLLVRLAERFGVDSASLAAEEAGGGAAALRRRLADPQFADLDIDRADVDEWLSAAPATASAFARLYDRDGGRAADGEARAEPVSVRLVRQEIERWRNHFADLDHLAEQIADELRLISGELYEALLNRLRTKHSISVRILPIDVMPERLRRVDMHARQLQLSELLPPHSRAFQAAVLLGQMEAREQIDALAAAAGFADRAALRLYRRHLAAYFAAAMMMPYARFLRACEATGYDLPLLERRFGAGFEQVAHRLTTLQRVGARGLPFFMLRVDRAGQVSKRYSGASGSPLVNGAAGCALWRVYDAFQQPTTLTTDLVSLEDDSRWFTLARVVESPARMAGAPPARFAVVIGIDAAFAETLVAAKGRDLRNDLANPMGLGCAICLRNQCSQRAAPPAGQTLIVNERERGLTPFDFAGE